MSTFIAGTYTATVTAPGGSALSIGQTAEGLRLEHQVFARQITGDLAGLTPQDGIFQGIAMFAQYTLIEYSAAGSAAVLWPYGSAYLSMGNVGMLMGGTTGAVVAGSAGAGLASSLILTALAGTPAAIGAAPATQTHPKAILAEGFPVAMLYGPDLREIPIRQRLYPTIAGSPSSTAYFTFGSHT